MEVIRIVFNSNTSFSIYNFRLGLMRHMKRNGFIPIAISPEDDYSQLLRSEFDYYPINNLDRKGTNPIKDIKLLLEYLTVFKNIKPSIVINYTIKPNIYGSLACRLLGIKSISVVTGLGYAFSKGKILRELVKAMYRISFTFNRYVIILNRGDMEVIKKLASEEKVFVLDGEGVDTTRYNPYLFKENKKDKNFILLYIGRFLREKGIYELVEAGKLLYKDRKDFELWLLGSIDKGNPGSISENELNLFKNLEFVKVLPFAKDVREFICKADCVTLPTYYGEGVPRSLLEAMSMEKPIITTDIPGCRELVSEKNGLLVKPRNIMDLYEKIKTFSELPDEEKIAMGKRGRQLILKKYDEKIIIEEYMKLIKKVLNL